MIGKVVEYPFDTIKVRLQSQPEHGPLRYSGPLDCFQQSLREGGLRSLYRGISAPMFGAAVETSSLFFSYRLAQRLVSSISQPPQEGEKLPLNALLFCGGASGAFTSALLTPIELVKCQMQVPQSVRASASTNPVTIIAAIYRHNGILGFWRGQLGTLIRETGGSAAWFGSYEGVCAAFRRYSARGKLARPDNQPVWQQLLAGASAGMAYNFICYPADTIKSRMQTEEVGGDARGTTKRNFWRVGRDLWAQQGIKGMYRGCGITVARAAPSSAFIFTIYETLLKWTK
jgi:ornithine carrier protein